MVDIKTGEADVDDGWVGKGVCERDGESELAAGFGVRRVFGEIPAVSEDADLGGGGENFPGDVIVVHLG